jgi:hypothetical protein
LEKLVGSTAGYISWWSTGGATILIVLTGQISGESLGGSFAVVFYMPRLGLPFCRSLWGHSPQFVYPQITARRSPDKLSLEGTGEHVGTLTVFGHGQIFSV